MRWILILLLASWTAACSADDTALHLDFDRVVNNGFVCAATGTVCQVRGKPTLQDGALLTSQFLTAMVPTLPALRGEDALTVSAWIAPAEAPSEYRSILYKGRRQAGGSRIHFFLSLYNGRPEFKFLDAEGRWQGILRNGDRFLLPGQAPVLLKDVPAVPARRWSHVAATFNAGHVELFLHGRPILAADFPTRRLIPNTHPLTIGAGESADGNRAYLLNGLVDEVRILNRALTADEVAETYRRERAGKPEGPVAVRPPLPEGYDPEFKTTIPLVVAYARKQLPVAARKQIAASVQPLDGVPTLHIDGKPVFAMAMMPDPAAADEGVTLSCRDFAAAGVDIYSEILWPWMQYGKGLHSWWLGPGRYDFERIDRRMRAILQANPNALLLPRIKLNMPSWWLKEHPEELARGANGKPAAQASLASELWEETYERMMRDVIRHMERSDYAGHIIGYHPCGGETSEWFWWGRADTVDFSPAAIKRLRRWLSERYHGDVAALRRAWGDDTVTFESVQPPSPGQRQATENLLFRHPGSARAWVEYQRFLNDMVSHNIERSCRIVKEETGGRKLAGTFYGYSAYCMDMVGFQGLARVLHSPYVDFLCSPTAYDRRRGGDPGVFVSAYTGSYRLHGKLYWDEVDTRTHLCPTFESYRTETLEETVSVLQRAAGHALTTGTGLWWFLLAGNATFHQAEVMDTVAQTKRAVDEALRADRRPACEVAVFADEESMLYSNTNPSFRNALLRGVRDELTCMGAPYDMYLLEDIAHPRLPDYKLYIFLNAFKVDDATRRAIDARVKRAGKTAVWVYTPGYLTDDGFSEEAMRSLTGITLRAHAESVPGQLDLTGAAHPITAASPGQRRWHWSVGPTFSVEDPGATVLGRTGTRTSLAVKEQDGWRSVYSLLPPSRELLRGLCRYAGVHLYSETLDPLTANRGYVMLHTATAGAKRITLPAPCDVTDALTGQVLGRRTRIIEEKLPASTTRIYRLTPR